MRAWILKLLGAKKRNEIRGGKLWEITRLYGFDLRKVETIPAQGEPLKKLEPMKIDKMRVHVMKPEDNVTNLTKKPDLL